MTVSTKIRGVDPLCKAEIAEALRRSVDAYDERGAWRTRAGVIMPDHVHLLVSVSDARRLLPLVTAWKRFIARHFEVRWEQGLFERRLRKEERIGAARGEARTFLAGGTDEMMHVTWTLKWNSEVVVLPALVVVRPDRRTGISSKLGTGQTIKTDSDDLVAVTLFQLARETGGRWIRQIDQLDEELATVVRQNSDAYHEAPPACNRS